MDMEARKLVPFTNEHFTAFLENMLGAPYWYGTCMYKCTEALRARKARQYPSHYSEKRTAQYRRDIEEKKVCADCIGAAKGYAWTDGGQGVVEAIGTDAAIANRYGSNKCPDKGANGMFAYAKSKGMAWGTIDTIPEIVGLAVTTAGHVGYYVGGGYVIEFKGFAYGSVKTELKKGKWTHWYMLPFLDYGTAGVTPGEQPDAGENQDTAYTLGSRLLKKGSQGEDVRELQRILLELGYALGSYGESGDGVDGRFGAATEKAVRAFQRNQQIAVDGKYGSVTHAALMGALADRDAMNTDDAQDENETSEGKTLRITADGVNVRTGPDKAFKIITRVNRGERFEYVATAEKQGWYAALIGGKVGWVCGEYAEVEEA